MMEVQVLNILPVRIRENIKKLHLNYLHLQEIRIRMNQFIILNYSGREIVMEEKANALDIKEMLEYISQYSLYAYEEELKQGFITIEGGHRVGFSGKAILENGIIKNMKYISSINIRVSHQIIGCSKSILPYIVKDKKICHTLIISPPRCGKTTILRDIIRLSSDGNNLMEGVTVGVVDERSELAGTYQGVAQNNLGCRTDVLDACPKVEGMMMLVRSMSPEIIAIDEIGKEEEILALEYAMHCGCKILGSVHGSSLEEIKKKPILKLLMEGKMFERYIVLGNTPKVGSIKGVYDGSSNLLYENLR